MWIKYILPSVTDQKKIPLNIIRSKKYISVCSLLKKKKAIKLVIKKTTHNLTRLFCQGPQATFTASFNNI